MSFDLHEAERTEAAVRLEQGIGALAARRNRMARNHLLKFLPFERAGKHIE